MLLLLQLVMLGFLFYLGIVSINEPMKMAKMLAAYAQVIFGKFFSYLGSNSELKDALLLIKSDPFEYEKRFGFQLAMVRLSGYVALFVSTVGACILVLANK